MVETGIVWSNWIFDFGICHCNLIKNHILLHWSSLSNSVLWDIRTLRKIAFATIKVPMLYHLSAFTYIQLKCTFLVEEISFWWKGKMWIQLRESRPFLWCTFMKRNVRGGLGHRPLPPASATSSGSSYSHWFNLGF